ncbi:uncharacterized protein PSFLO_01389 [Pseudozyma flocculosa]|uniref:Uncharacterized protein n=1 Tax=Pseudozyma flocculosa TaxID=84751 RepID=A0A5C3EUC8_9BASI|nr:uncharacterized protein PSFLO_01389 [Pseudozyma flocculosa]
MQPDAANASECAPPTGPHLLTCWAASRCPPGFILALRHTDTHVSISALHRIALQGAPEVAGSAPRLWYEGACDKAITVALPSGARDHRHLLAVEARSDTAPSSAESMSSPIQGRVAPVDGRA